MTLNLIFEFITDNDIVILYFLCENIRYISKMAVLLFMTFRNY